MTHATTNPNDPGAGRGGQPGHSAHPGHPGHLGPEPTRIDCDSCVVRGLACHDCVVTVLLGPPPELAFDDEESRALDVLAQGGLIPPLRMVAPQDGVDVESA